MPTFKQIGPVAAGRATALFALLNGQVVFFKLWERIAGYGLVQAA